MPLEPRLSPFKVVPLWTLPDKYGESFNLAKNRRRAHLLLLVCAPNADATAFLQQLAPELPELQSLPGRAIVVVASEDAAGPIPAPPFTVVIDAEGSVRRRYLPDGAAAGLFVLDRYGALYHQWLVEDVARLPDAQEAAGWLQAVGMQCGV